MSIVKLKEYGTDLAGREFGKKVYALIMNDISLPIELDFEGVGSMGSSFADEVVVKIARQQGDSITVRNLNRVVKSCLNDVSEDSGIVPSIM